MILSYASLLFKQLVSLHTSLTESDPWADLLSKKRVKVLRVLPTNIFQISYSKSFVNRNTDKICYPNSWGINTCLTKFKLWLNQTRKRFLWSDERTFWKYSEYDDTVIQPKRHLLVQNQKEIHQNNVQNLLKVNNKGDYQNKVNDVVLVSYYELWKDLTHCSAVFIVDFEQVNTGWRSVLKCSC